MQELLSAIERETGVKLDPDVIIFWEGGVYRFDGDVVGLLPHIKCPLDLNAASIDELQTMRGIGPALAKRIAEHRKKKKKFGSVEELKEVSGIGPKRFEDLRDKVIIG